MGMMRDNPATDCTGETGDRNELGSWKRKRRRNKYRYDRCGLRPGIRQPGSGEGRKERWRVTEGQCKEISCL